MISRRNILKTTAVAAAASFVPFAASVPKASAAVKYPAPVFYSTGFPDLDKVIGGGLFAGSVNVICGEVGTYKTKLQKSIGEHIFWSTRETTPYSEHWRQYTHLDTYDPSIECVFVSKNHMISSEEYDFLHKVFERKDLCFYNVGNYLRKLVIENEAICIISVQTGRMKHVDPNPNVIRVGGMATWADLVISMESDRAEYGHSNRAIATIVKNRFGTGINGQSFYVKRVGQWPEDRIQFSKQ